MPAQARSLQSRKLRPERGLSRARPRGASMEFASLREYCPSDEPRRIDWRASARARRLMVGDVHLERSHAVLIAVDCGRLMSGHATRTASKLDCALGSSIDLAQACIRNGDRVGFLALDRELRAFVAPQRRSAVLASILEATLEVTPSAHECSYRKLLEVLRERQPRRALIVVLTDFTEGGHAHELETYLALLARKHVVLMVGIRDVLLRELDRAQPTVAGLGIYRRLVLQELDVARATALSRLGKLGVHTLDLDAASITTPLLARYQSLFESGSL
jgi:uncharacterized protein (DUF58 family)